MTVSSQKNHSTHSLRWRLPLGLLGLASAITGCGLGFSCFGIQLARPDGTSPDAKLPQFNARNCPFDNEEKTAATSVALGVSGIGMMLFACTDTARCKKQRGVDAPQQSLTTTLNPQA